MRKPEFFEVTPIIVLRSFFLRYHCPLPYFQWSHHAAEKFRTRIIERLL